MLNGSERFLKKEELVILSKLLAKQKKKIDEYVKKIMKNNYELQKNLSKEGFLEGEFSYYSAFESKVGLFSSFMQKNNIYYLIGYLNELIHSLLTVTRQFSIYYISKFKYLKNEPIQQFIESCKQLNRQRNYKFKEEDEN